MTLAFTKKKINLYYKMDNINNDISNNDLNDIDVSGVEVIDDISGILLQVHTHIHKKMEGKNKIMKFFVI